MIMKEQSEMSRDERRETKSVVVQWLNRADKRLQQSMEAARDNFRLELMETAKVRLVREKVEDVNKQIALLADDAAEVGLDLQLRGDTPDRGVVLVLSREALQEIDDRIFKEFKLKQTAMDAVRQKYQEKFVPASAQATLADLKRELEEIFNQK